MTFVRSDGLTRCAVATQGVTDAINAFNGNDEYVVNSGRIVDSSDIYDVTCPANDPNSKKFVSIWGFEGSILIPITPGFVHPSTANGYLAASGFYQVNPAHPDLLVPKPCTFGRTPLAQGMFEAARVFGDIASLPPAGEVRSAIILTDGEENESEGVPLPAGSTRVRAPGDPATANIDAVGTWGNKVFVALNSRGVKTTGFLYGGGAVSASAAKSLVAARGERSLAPDGFSVLTATVTPSSTADDLFFQQLAARTGGRFVPAPDNAPVAASSSLLDSDGDGIPDFRDLCDAPGCVDGDGDGIPTSVDQCQFSAEDGRGPNPGDGCPDGDSDGIPDDRDACRSKIEDYVPPKPTDGCPSVATAAPASSTLTLLLLGLGLGGMGLVVVRKRRQELV